MNDGAPRLWVATTHADRRAFAAAAVPFLARAEAIHNLQLSVLDQVVRGGRYPEAHLVAAVDVAGAVLDLALRTPPHPLLLPLPGPPAARAAVLGWFLIHDPDLPGMVGLAPEVRDAAAWWAARRGVVVRRAMRQGVYALHAVRPAARAAGHVRPVTAADRERVVPWLRAFAAEAEGTVQTDAEAAFASFVDDPVRQLFVWVAPDGDTVALAGRNGRTPHGVRIGPVFTPPERRGHGYGEALVAALSQQELDAGARACFLYTDLDYAPSNRLYLRIGYAPLGEAANLRFAPADASKDR